LSYWDKAINLEFLIFNFESILNIKIL